MTLAALNPTVDMNDIEATNVETNFEKKTIETKPAEPEITTDRPARISNGRISLNSEHTIVGIASFYDEPQPTASGEQFDPNAFTAAAQLAIRDKFGGIKYGRLYRPAFGVADYEGKRVILKFNDVGPLRPGRKFDLSRAAFAYFSGLKKGLLPDFRVTPLPIGQIYPMGPVTDEELAALGIGDDDAELTTASVTTRPAIETRPAAVPPSAYRLASAAQPLAHECPGWIRVSNELVFSVTALSKVQMGRHHITCDEDDDTTGSIGARPLPLKQHMAAYRVSLTDGSTVEIALSEFRLMPMEAEVLYAGIGQLWNVQ